MPFAAVAAMDNKQIKIDAADVEISWDEEPEIPSDPQEALMAGIKYGKKLLAEKEAMEKQGGAKIPPAPSNGLESQGKGGCGPKDETLKLREAWLREAYQRITGQEGVISCGYGKGGSRSTKGYSVHKDETGVNQIFIHPSISKKDGALLSLLEAGREAGLTLPSFGAWLEQVGSAMPPYPQHKLAESTEDKKDGIRQLKVVCPVCGYTARTSRKWLDKAGAPVCPTPHLKSKWLTCGVDSKIAAILTPGAEGAMDGDVLVIMIEADKPIEIDLDTESVTKSGDNLEVKTKPQ